MSDRKGGCACGSVRYACSGAPQFSFHCCCRQCQRASGGGHTSLFIATSESLTLSGELAYYARKGASGNTVRSGFCPTCGSPVMSHNSGYPDVRYLHAATLDDPTQFEPEKVVFSSERQPWDHLDPALE